MSNFLLSALPAHDRASLLPFLEATGLRAGQTLESATRPAKSLCFLNSGIAAVFSISGGKRIGLGLIGPEGASGVALMLGDDRSPHETFMLTAGEGFRLSAEGLDTAMRADGDIRRLLLRYALAFYNQAAHTALSNASSTIVQRVARWLLMANDRLGGKAVPMTHRELAELLAVRRAGVTGAMDRLRDAHLIELGRGRTIVKDRIGIEKIASGFYGVPEREYARLLGVAWPVAKGEAVGRAERAGGAPAFAGTEAPRARSD